MPHSSTGDTDPNADAGTRYGFASDTTALLIDVTVSQALFAGLLGVAAVLAGVPSAELGLGPDAIELGAVGNGLALGAGFWLGSTGASVLARRAGYPVGSRLRSLIAPDSVGGWLLLVGVALPVVAVSEEFVFRGALVGVASAGLGISPWPAVVVGGLAFGVAHVGQGRIGMALAAALGVLLGGAFVLSGSLLTVVVAHYVVNLLEMVVYALTRQEEGPFGSA